MSINKFNAEGYYDPTAYAPLLLLRQSKRRCELFAPLSISARPMQEILRAILQRHGVTAVML